VTVAPTDCILSRDPARMDDSMKFIADNAIVTNHQDVLGVWSRLPAAPSRSTGAATAARPGDGAGGRNAGGQTAGDPGQRNQQLAEIVNPKHTVLLVHEMTNDSHHPNGVDFKRGTAFPADEDAKVLPHQQKLMATARAKKVRVVFARYTSHADGSTSNNAGIEATVRRGSGGGGGGVVRVVDGTWGWAQMDEVKPEPGEWIIRKYRPDAFFASTLDALLRWNGVKTIVLIGSGATVGVVPTLSSARNNGYATVAVSDAIVARDPKRMPEALRVMADNAIMSKTEEIVELWNRR
jgi:nicotinamidase-related amidase